MTRLRSTVLLLAALVAISSATAYAQTVKLLATGPASLSQPLALAAVNGRAGPNSHHWTGRAQLIKQGSPPLDGDVWVVWSSDEKNIWAYVVLDSAAPSTLAKGGYKLQIDSGAMALPGRNKIASPRFQSGDSCPGEPQSGHACDAPALPQPVANSLSQAGQVSVVNLSSNMPHCGHCGPDAQMELHRLREVMSGPDFQREFGPGNLKQPVGTENVQH